MSGTPRTAATMVGWLVAGVMFLGAMVAAYETLTFPSALAAHPVLTSATVTDQFIDGFGGDPSVDYRYTVRGRSYTGYGTGDLGGEDPTDLHRGDPIMIEYAAGAPSQSCTCDAKSSADRAPLAADAVFAAPLLLLIVWTVSGKRRRWGGRIPERS